MQISVTADAPLLFWSLLSAGVSRKTPIAAQALAGVSAPLCTACGIEPFAIAAKNASDPVNFGLADPTDPTLPTNYTFYYNCLGTTPAFLPNSGQYAPYTIINRYDAASTTVPDETDQLFRLGASGLRRPPRPIPPARRFPWDAPASAIRWKPSGAAPHSPPCRPSARRPCPKWREPALCGLYSRVDNTTLPAACTTAVTDYSALAAAAARGHRPGNHAGLYTAYQGNGRRVITVVVVDALRRIRARR